MLIQDGTIKASFIAARIIEYQQFDAQIWDRFFIFIASSSDILFHLVILISKDSLSLFALDLVFFNIDLLYNLLSLT